MDTVTIRKWGAAAEVRAGDWWRACAATARRVRSVGASAGGYAWSVGASAAGRLRSACTRRRVRWAALVFLLLLLLPTTGLMYHVYLDESDLPGLEPFIRFEPPTVGEIYDARGHVLIASRRCA
jgi:hypothetical protein